MQDCLKSGTGITKRMDGCSNYAYNYFQWLLEQKENYWFVITRGILGLPRMYDNDVVNKALARALLYEIKEVSTIAVFLRNHHSRWLPC